MMILFCPELANEGAKSDLMSLTDITRRVEGEGGSARTVYRAVAWPRTCG